MQKRIKDLKFGEVHSGGSLNLLLSSAKKDLFKAPKEGFYYTLEFQDITGHIEGKMWSVPEEFKDLDLMCKERKGIYVSLSCVVDEFQDKLQLKVTGMRIIPDENVDPNDFLQVTIQDREELWLEVRRLISQVKDIEFRNLLIAVFEEFKENFLKAIGGLRHHHNYIGGLLEHSLQVALLSLYSVKNKFLFPELNTDLIITSALLHDIGKVDEYLYSKSFQYNDFAIEHRYAGIGILDRIIQQKNLIIDSKKLRDLKQIIITHHGSFGDASIRMDIPEAVVIHSADLMSAHVNGMLNQNGLLGIPYTLSEEVKK